MPWREEEPCSVVGECERETHEQVWRLQSFGEPQTDRIRILVGDVLHNLRQSLDHLAHSISGIVRGEDPGERSAFPITDDPKAFPGLLGGNIGSPNAMPPGLAAAFENVQPYKGGYYPLLFALKKLHDRDKHREPTVVAGGAAAMETLIENVALRGGIQLGDAGFVENGEAMLKFHGEVLNENPNVDLTVTPDVIFGRDSPVVPRQPVLDILETLRALIAQRVFPSLEPFLGAQQGSASTEKGYV